MKLIAILASACLAVTPALAAPAAPAPADVVAKVQKFYATINQVTAQFRQEVSFKTFGQTKTSDGMVWIAKPGKMRWDYLEKKPNGTVEHKKSFISDGTTLYDIEHGNKQVVKKNLSQDLLPVAVTFLYGKGDLSAEFNAELDPKASYGDGKSDIVLRLTPKQPSAQYKYLYLVVSKDDYHVKESVIVDSSENVNHFHFYAPDFEKPIKDSWFTFNPASAPNYRMIDGDQQQGSGGGAPAAAPAPALAPAPAPPAAPKKP